MNFDFINQLCKLLQENNMFQFSITGAKGLAIALLLFKVVEHFIKNIEDMSHNPRLGNIYWIFASTLFIISSSWIITLFEDLFAIVDVKMGNTESSLYTDLQKELKDQFEKVFSNSETSWYDWPGLIIQGGGFLLSYAVALLLMICCKIADLSMTAGYLLSRVFLIQLMKFIFPIVIALNTLDAFKDLFYKWIKRYIGLLVLGMGYIGVIHFCSLVQKALHDQFKTSDVMSGMELNAYTWGAIITIVVVFTLKIKLFSTVTSWINSFFS